MKIVKFLLVSILILILIVILVLGYFGFIPALSNLMGTNKPRDLGVMYSEEMYLSGLEKSGVEIKTLPISSGETISYEGSHSVTASFTDDELTSNSHWKEEWSDFPIREVQVRINDDNSAEVSGVLVLDKMDDFLATMNISPEGYREALSRAKIPITDIAFYGKGTGVARNNSLEISISAVEVGRFPVPIGIVDEYQDDLASFGETLMTRIPGFSVNEALFENGSIFFNGTLPDAELKR